MTKRTINDFISKAREVHGNKYDYSKVNYINCKTKVCIICPIHGYFWQTPDNHLQGKRCPKCSKVFRINTESFIEMSKRIHGDKYDYSKVNYVNNHTDVCIICPKHGEFWQRPSVHLIGNGCRKCGRVVTSKKLRGNLDGFISKAKEKYGSYFSYKNAHYTSATDSITITCPKHGDFVTTPNAFLSQKHGCPICAKEYVAESHKLTQDEFIKRAKELHGDTYDYSLCEYVSYEKKVKIICKKHGVFEQTPDRHLQGSGCHNCRLSHGENVIRKFLENKNIYFEQQYKIELEKQLFSTNNIRVDFFVPTLNTIIEFNGIQHYEYVPIFHKEDDGFEKQRFRDKRLEIYCKKNRIKLVVIRYDQIDNIEEILNNELNNKQLWQKRKQN